MRLSLKIFVVLLATLLLGANALASGEPRADARSLVEQVDGVVAALGSGSAPGPGAEAARARWDAFNDRWLAVEDPIRGVSPELYRRIEERMQDVTGALPRGGEWQLGDARTALADLRLALLAVAALPESTGPAPGTITLEAFLAVTKSAARRATSEGGAQAAFTEVNDAWFQVESRVSAIDRGAYGACEGALGEARTASRCGDAAGVLRAIQRLQATVEPLARKGGHVGALEAALIILREGAEALIVLAAIAAFLARLGAPGKARLIWAGGALGLLASLAGGALLVKLFAGVTAGERREVVEGVSSLLAAVLLVVVGQWLHEKIRRGGWKKDVQEALESGRRAQLLLVAFLAVFREGAETVVFFAGIAPASTPHELALGTGLGFVLLAVLGALLLGLGRRLPIGVFLHFATVLLWLLAVKFVGGGVVALQTGGVVRATRFADLPDVPLLGFAPTLESVGAQVLAVLAWTAFTLTPRWRHTLWRKKPELSSIEA